MASLLVHWDFLLARLTASVVPVTRRILAGVGVTLFPLDGQLDEDVTVAVKPHADASILADSDGVRVGIISNTQHGSRGGGTLHANAVAGSPGTAGFMSGAQAAQLAGTGAPIPLPTYTVGTLPSAATYARGMIYVSDEAGGAVPAFSDGTNWRRVTDRAIVS